MDFVCEHKFDGLAIALIYENGFLLLELLGVMAIAVKI